LSGGAPRIISWPASTTTATGQRPALLADPGCNGKSDVDRRFAPVTTGIKHRYAGLACQIISPLQHIQNGLPSQARATTRDWRGAVS